MGKNKDDNVSEYDFQGSNKDDKNLTKAGKGWEEDTKDPAIELLKGIRQETEED